jgi:competence protein ComEA
VTDSEARALARTTVVLLLAGAVRWGLSTRTGDLPIPADSAQALPALLEESRREREDAARRSAPLADGETVDPNVASEADLDRLPGVGPAAARAIIAAREAAGGFGSAEDLLSVRGIGPATLERMRPHLAFARAYAARAGAPPAGGSGERSGTGVARGGPGGAPGPPGAPLPLNGATLEELERLPGVGPALAQRILEERRRRGAFASVDDLLDVRGIGPATLERLRPLVSAP